MTQKDINTIRICLGTMISYGDETSKAIIRRALKSFDELIEDISTMKMVKERVARDTGKRYSYEEVMEKIKRIMNE